MLVLAREAKGWTQRDLAAKSGLSQAAVSKIEGGATDVFGERLEHLAEVLNCPPALLTRPALRVEVANTCLHHRRRHSKLSAAATKRVEGVAHLTRVSVEGIFDGIHAQLDTDLDPAAVLNHANGIVAASPAPSEGFDPRRADAAARYVRDLWALRGPVENLIATLERRGILVLYRSLGSRAQDGVSSWPADAAHPPIIVVNEDLSADRLRFTVAHELAHLLLHRIPTEDAEREANRFAAEFLVPAKEIAPALEGLTTADLARLAEMKTEWRVSIGVLIQRARDIGVISDRQFREFRVRLAKLGWDVNEPGAVPRETPTLLDKAIAVGRDQRGLSIEALADMAYMTPSSFQWHYLRPGQVDQAPRQVLNLDDSTDPAGPTKFTGLPVSSPSPTGGGI